jgi:hypothetical protein
MDKIGHAARNTKGDVGWYICPKLLDTVLDILVSWGAKNVVCCGMSNNMLQPSKVWHLDVLKEQKFADSLEAIQDYKNWTKRYWLTADIEVIEQRINSPDRTNPFGKDPKSWERVKSCHERLTKPKGWDVVDTTNMSIEQVFEFIVHGTVPLEPTPKLTEDKLELYGVNKNEEMETD